MCDLDEYAFISVAAIARFFAPSHNNSNNSFFDVTTADVAPGTCEKLRDI